MAAPHLLGWARSEVMCRDMARLPPGTLYLLTSPVMTSSASKHSPTELGTRGTEKEGVPTFLVSMVSNQEICAGKPSDVQATWIPKGHWMECGTLSFESETVCVNSAIFLCQPSVLRQHRKSGWRVCNTDHTGLGKGLCSCREPCRSLVSVVKGLLHRRAGSSPCLKTLPVWIRGP